MNPMTPDYNAILSAADVGGFFRRLETLYAAMDRDYDAAARHYGFFCAGCGDNCCLTRFYHHTAIEYAYLLSGFFQLPRDRRIVYMERAAAYSGELEGAERGNKAFRHMCPLNDAGLCVLYDYRPMICRLHGIPHELSPPGQAKTFGAGCDAFEAQCGHIAYRPFDRTPFYTGLAGLERRFREQAGAAGKFKMTVAGMLISTRECAL